jgi:hypothetical protein
VEAVDFTRVVPSAVPSVTKIPPAELLVRAAKNNWLPTATRLFGFELDAPGRRSLIIFVPAGVPSVTQSSVPAAGSN